MASTVKLSISKIYFFWMAGHFINYLIPIRAGELAKSIFLKKTDSLAISRTLPSVFIDKMFDSIAIFIVLILWPFLNITVSRILILLIALLLLVVIISIVILIYSSLARERVVRIIHKIFFFLPKRFEERFLYLLNIFIEGIGLFRHHLNLLPKVILLTILAVLLDSIYFSFVFLAFNQNINFFMILFGYTLINLSYILPQPPAQIGSNEIMMVIIFSVGLGLDKEMVSAVMAGAHIMTGLLISGIGLLALNYTGTRLLDLKYNSD